MTAQTSDRVSKLAARYIKMTPERLAALMEPADGPQRVARELHTMAASLLRQDEVKGLRGLLKKVIG